MGYFEQFISDDLAEVLENIMKIYSDNEFPHNFLNILEEMFGKDNIRGFNPNSFYEIENWKGYLIDHKSVIIKVENLEKYLKLILRKRSLIIETTDINGFTERYNIRKNCSESDFRSAIFDLINVGTTNFEETIWFKYYEKSTRTNGKKFNKELFEKNYKKDLNIDVTVEKILENDIVKIFLLKTPSGNILFDSSGNLIIEKNVQRNIVSYTDEYIEQLKDLGIEF